MKSLFFVCLAVFVVFAGCAPATLHRDHLRDDEGDRVTVGTVQREITVGMSAAEVAAALGSPNIVSTDENRNEVWIYDKIATEILYSRSGAGIAFLTPGRAGGQTRSQRTLTIIIKFDEDKQVNDFAYHTSRF